MNYRIERHLKEIYVICNDQIILTVKYRYAFSGKTIYQFYQDDLLILEITYLVAFFRKYLTIEVQNLDSGLETRRNKGDYVFIHNNKQLRIKKKYFKNPLYHLLIDKKVVGGVSTKLWGIVETPTIYDIEFYVEDEENIYLIILFITNCTTDLIS